MTADSELHCGCCSYRCQSISELHVHLCGHTQTSSYVFDITTCTGYPRLDSVSCGTQTHKDEFTCSQDGFTQTEDELYWSSDYASNACTYIKQETEAESCSFGDILNGTDDLLTKLKPKPKTFLVSDIGLKQDIPDINKEHKDTHDDTFNVVKVEPDVDNESNDNDEEFAPDFNIDEETDDEYEPPKPKKIKPKKIKQTTVKLKTQKPKAKISHKPSVGDHKCKFCENGFKTKCKLVKHILNEHPGEKAYKCKDCEESFDTPRDRYNHSRREHTKEENIECSRCNLKLKSSALLRQHVKRHHDISYDHMCAKCGKLFKTSGDLYHHKMICAGTRKFKCEVCEKMFYTKRMLTNHMRSHTGETPFVCDQCGNRYRYRDSFNTHKLSHTGERPFVCSFCPQSFTQRSSYRDHMKIHNQDLNFVCPYCSKRFVKKYNLKVHVRQHTGEMPFKCDKCGQGFKQNVLLKAHMVHQHKNDSSRDEISHGMPTTSVNNLGLQSTEELAVRENDSTVVDALSLVPTHENNAEIDTPTSALTLEKTHNPGWLQPFPSF